MDGNQTSSFLGPWNGELIPCNNRFQCRIDHHAWRISAAICEKIVRHPSQPGYIGYCRCGTFSFRAGPLCLGTSSLTDIMFPLYLSMEFLLVLLVLALLFSFRKAKRRSRTRLRFRSPDRFINIIMLLAFAAGLTKLFSQWFVQFRFDDGNLDHLADATSVGIWISLYMTLVAILLTSCAYVITAYRFYKLLLLIQARMVKKKHRGNRWYLPCLVAVAIVQLVSASVYVYNTVTGNYGFASRFNLATKVVYTLLLPLMIWKVTTSLAGLSGLKFLIRLLHVRTFFATLVNVFSTCLLGFSMYGFSAPKPIDDKFSVVYLSVLAGRVGNTLQLLCLLYFYNGLCYMSGDMNSTTHASTPAPQGHVTGTQTSKDTHPASSRRPESTPGMREQHDRSLEIQDDDIDDHALTVV